MLLAAQSVLIACLVLVTWTYAGYPLSLAILAAVARRREISGDEEKPSVSLVVSVFNEESVLREKLENALGLDYPRDRLQIMVVSDGSTDASDDIARSFESQGVELYRLEERRGKESALQEFISHARGDVVVFSDANSMYRKDALRTLVRQFSDPEVGFVTGRQLYHGVGDRPVSDSESLYLKYENVLKRLEQRVGSVVGADGAIYAIRRHLFTPLQEDDISDFVNALRIVVQGYRGAYEEDAVCYEQTADDFSGEFRRKVRIVNRSLRAVVRTPQALYPWRVGLFAYEVLFHKVVRWFVPYFLIGLLVSSLTLTIAGQGPLYPVILGLQLCLLAMAGLHWVWPGASPRPLYVAYYFHLVNAAALVGTWGMMRGRRFATWTTERRSRA